MVLTGSLKVYGDPEGESSGEEEAAEAGISSADAFLDPRDDPGYDSELERRLGKGQPEESDPEELLLRTATTGHAAP